MTHQHDEENQNDAQDAHAAVTETVSVAAKATAEAAKQKDYENDDKYESDGHILSPVGWNSPNFESPRGPSLRRPTKKARLTYFVWMEMPPLPTLMSTPAVC